MPGFSFAPRSRSRLPSGPTSPTHSSYSRSSSPTPFERGRLSVSAPNIAALARSDPPPLLPPCPLEIQLSSDTVVLRSTGTEAETTHLTGSVILHLPSATDIKGVGLRLLATARVAPPSDGYASLDGLSLVQSSMSLLELGRDSRMLRFYLNATGTSWKATRLVPTP